MKKLIFLFLIVMSAYLSATTMQQVEREAHYGNVYAQYDLGIRYKYAQQTPKNLRKAFKWLHKAALKGHSLSQYEFGLLFHYGQGVRQNAELARLWLTRAAKRGHPQAQEILYRFYAAKKPHYFRGTPLRFSLNFRQYR